MATSLPALAQSAATSPAMSTVTTPAEADELPPPPPSAQPTPSPFEHHSPLFEGERDAVTSQPPPVSDIAADIAAGSASDTTSDSPPPPAPAPAPPVALPAGSGVLDSATIQRIVERLLALHFLTSSADAGNSDAMTQAIKDFQSSAGISPTGTLDRDTIGRLTTP